MLLPLHMLEPGQTAEIEAVVGQSDHVHRHELGLRNGVAIEMLQSGTPCIVRVADQRLCFRDADLFSILVRPRTCS